MPYPIEEKLVIAVSSSALFDLTDSDRVFQSEGEEAYRLYQEQHLDHVLPKGVAFPFIRRFLQLNQRFPDEQPVEVVLLSRNSPETGMRVFRSIRHYALDISRAAFFSGSSPFLYNEAFNASLFLSANRDDVQAAIRSGFPAGLVLQSDVVDDPSDDSLKLAFDFDGVLVDDQAEQIYQQSGSLDDFHDFEDLHRMEPLQAGPLSDLLRKIAHFQQLEQKRRALDASYHRILKVAIITARSAPAHERMIRTLKSWNISVDETFFMGGIEKRRVLEVMKPHIFFDDQVIHLKKVDGIALVHIPFGRLNSNDS
jgi:5'-nucleotidase